LASPPPPSAAPVSHFAQASPVPAADGGGVLGVPSVHVSMPVAAGLPSSVMLDGSLGAQVAKAMPDDLRSLALELVDNTELQDQTIALAKQPPDPDSRGGSPEPGDIDSYLWDFLETSQALDEAHDLAQVADHVIKAEAEGDTSADYLRWDEAS